MRPSILDEMLPKKGIIAVAQIAPAVRVSLGELFGYAPGEVITKKIVCALKKLGFEYVFDTSFGADVAVMEESKEMADRLKVGGPFPMINSCCPGTVSYLEHSYPELVPYMASVKSPMEVEGVLIKTYFAEKLKIPKEKIFSVAVMPCVIKKAEFLRPELRLEGKLVIDGVITTMELAQYFKANKIDLKNCKEAEFDSLLGTASGAGQIFGSSGGVSEAAIRNYAYLNNIPIEKLDTKDLRGPGEVREITFNLRGQKIRIAVVNSLRNAPTILNDKKKLSSYHFVEIMACYGGCVGGAGQPPSTKEIIAKRREGLYSIDSKLNLKVPAQNPDIQKLYKDFLGSPRSKKSLKLLHTSFAKTCSDCF